MKKLIAFLTLFFLSLGFAGAQRIGVVPIADSSTISVDEYFPVERIRIDCDDPSSISWANDHLSLWYRWATPKAESGKSDYSKGILSYFDWKSDEAYILSVEKDAVHIKANTINGVRYALYSLRQLVIAKRGTLQVEGWIAPKTNIVDKPKSTFRGIHICWFRENEPWEIERLIRLAAYYKMNYAVVESWGTFKSEINPWMSWPDSKMTKEEIERLSEVAKDLGITLIPQINVFGHASNSRGAGVKHSVLDIHPEYQSLFEPLNGWNWCLSNPKSKDVLISLVREMYEAYGKPPYFHIGGDEAMKPSCPDCCHQSYSGLFVKHISAITDEIEKLGARPMMWHDMLLENNDPRWQPFYAHGTKETASALKSLSKKIIICDWFYGDPQETYPTMDYFKKCGFDVLASPWDNKYGMHNQIRYAQKQNMYGVLGTLWHHFYGFRLHDVYCHLSSLMWYGDDPDSKLVMDYFGTHLRNVCWDMNITDPEKFGYFHNDIPEPTLLD